MKVFISGSKTIETLPERVKEYIANLAGNGSEFIVGDCAGADKAAQDFLSALNVKKVTVYCSGKRPRNNVGGWEVVALSVKGLKGYEFYRAKDIKMAEDCDFALAVWDGESRGTKANIDEMKRLNKPVSVFYTCKLSRPLKAPLLPGHRFFICDIME